MPGHDFASLLVDFNIGDRSRVRRRMCAESDAAPSGEPAFRSPSIRAISRFSWCPACRVRDGVDPWKLSPDTLRLPESTVVSDPRNVLPLASPPPRRARCAPKLVAPTRRYWLGGAMSLALTPVEPQP